MGENNLSKSAKTRKKTFSSSVRITGPCQATIIELFGGMHLAVAKRRYVFSQKVPS